MATDTSAARDAVLAARAELAGELDRLNASARSAVDVRARVRESPGKAAAVLGGVGFLALKGPQRILGGVKRIVRGKPEPLPPSLLPDQIEKSLKALGSDGAAVRGAIERDFADYAAKATGDRRRGRRILLMSALQPVIVAGVKRGTDWLLSPNPKVVDRRLADLRARAEQAVADITGEATGGGEISVPPAPTPSRGDIPPPSQAEPPPPTP